MVRAAIRLASPQEHADLEQLLHALSSAQCKLSTEPTHIGQKHVFVAETSGPIGVLVLLRDQDVAVIDALAVDPIHRGQGTGSDLVRAAERFLASEAKDPGQYLALSCVPSDAAERFAQRLGFAEYSGEFDAVTGARLVVYRKPVGDNHVPDASMGDDIMGAFLAQVDGSEDPSLAASAKTPLFASILSTMRLDTLEALATDLGSTACIEMLTDDDGDDDRETPESLDSLVCLLMTQLRDPSHAELVTSFRPSPESFEEKE